MSILPNVPGGLFSGLGNMWNDPAMKAGLLQAGLSMLNPNPNSSPFAQIATGVAQGAMAHQRYRDLATQEMQERQDALAAQQSENAKEAMRMKLDQARIQQIENNIRTSQENARSLTTLRGAQTERAKRAPASGSGGSRAFDSAWRSFYRQKLQDPSMLNESVTPELLQQWKSEFETLEGSRPSGGASPVAPTASGASGAPTMQLPGGLTPERIQAIADEEGITFEEAMQMVQELQ